MSWPILKLPLRIRLTTAALLCLFLPGQIAPAQAIPSPSSEVPASKTQGKLDPDQRILHLLNRFTFGPTPQDIAAVRQLDQKNKDVNKAIDRWFEQQLDPGNIPDPRLNARLNDFPALLLPTDQLMEQFPNGASIRRAANDKHAIPNDPYLAALYLRHIDLYQEKQAKKASSSAKPGQDEPGTTTTAQDNMVAPTVSQPKAETVTPQSPSTIPTSSANSARPTYLELLTKTVLALPPDQRVNRILDMSPTEYTQFHASLKGPQKAQLTQNLNPYQREFLADYDNPTPTVVEELQSQRLLRDILSSRQLQEVMTTFWLNHFNIYLHKNEQTPYYLVSYERDVVEPLALGNFEDLLIAIAESPAMLLYLDNSSSTGPNSATAEKRKQRIAFDKIAKPNLPAPPGLNENYARELMELHTLGVNGGYTQADVTEVAKIFTGWTIDRPQQGGGFIFDESRHEPGKKLFMGHKIKENGQKEGLQLLHILATSPATAHFISQELASAFVSDTPPPALVDRMAKVFLKTHGDIPSLLRTMLHAPEFWAPENYQAKIKTPLEYVVSAVRASGAEITNPQPLINQLNQMGMPLYACVPPTGYSLKADAWVSTGALVTRMNFGLSLSNNHYPGIHTDWTSPTPETAAGNAVSSDAERAIEARLIPTGISEQTRAALLTQAQDQAQKSPPPPSTIATSNNSTSLSAQKATAGRASLVERQNAQLAGLLLGSPEFQRR